MSQAEFLRRTHHALARDAENFPFLDDERFLVAGLQRQREIRQDERDLVAGLVILCAANNGAFAFAIVDLANGELVRAGHGVAREDLGDDDAVERAGDFLHALDFEAEHGEPLGQFLGRPVEINVLFEPVKGDFHSELEYSKLLLVFCFALQVYRIQKYNFP